MLHVYYDINNIRINMLLQNSKFIIDQFSIVNIYYCDISDYGIMRSLNSLFAIYVKIRFCYIIETYAIFCLLFIYRKILINSIILL